MELGQQVEVQARLEQPAHLAEQVEQAALARLETLARLAPTELADMQEAARQRVEQVERLQVRLVTGIMLTAVLVSTITLGQTITGGHFNMDTKAVLVTQETPEAMALAMLELVVVRGTLAHLGRLVLPAMLALQVIPVLLVLRETQGLTVQEGQAREVAHWS
jgi:hypothetical protein